MMMMIGERGESGEKKLKIKGNFWSGFIKILNKILKNK